MKKRGIKIIISAILFVLALVIPFSNEWINNGLFIISYLVVGFEILKSLASCPSINNFIKA